MSLLISTKSVLCVQGERLNLASTASDVSVYIGNETCSDLVLGEDNVTCYIPFTKPAAIDTNGTAPDSSDTGRRDVAVSGLSCANVKC